MQMKRLLITACSVAVLFCAGGPAEAQLTDEAVACLNCHGQKGISISFKDGGTAEAHVRAEVFGASVHAALGCTACHGEFTDTPHPERRFGSKAEYSARTAAACRQCHTDEALKEQSIHTTLLAKDSGAPLCTTCHGAHGITAVAGGRTVAGEKQYCLKCHSHALTMVMKNNEVVSLKVDPAVLNSSVHAKLSCFDCHFGFSPAEHPQRAFGSSREFTLANADACRRCHFDKYSKTLDSVHYSMLSKGKLEAPVCTDCHGAHTVSAAKADKEETARTCKTCHNAVYKIYRTSVHGAALMKERNADVPVCTDCHSVHAILDPRTLDYREKVPEICGKCHANKELMRKYGLYAGVVNSYLEDFHGMTLKLYRKEGDAKGPAARRSIATCVDCHGVHDITKAKGPGTNLVKARLVNQCRQCHPGASDEFPDAWLSHYEPTLANAPLVFMIVWTYRIFIPFMLIGLVLQIALHIWRYAMYR